jgi:Fe-S oxidoreductase
LDSLTFWLGQETYIRNIMMPVLIGVGIIFPVLFVIFVAGFMRRARIWALGRAEKRNDSRLSRLMTTLGAAIPHTSFWHKGEFYPTLMHKLIFVGACLLFLGKIVRLFSFAGLTMPPQAIYLYASFVSEIGGAAIIVGGIMAVVRRFIIKPKRLDNQTDDTVVYLLAFTVVLTGFMIKGYRISVSDVSPTDWTSWSPVGYLISRLFLIFGPGTRNELLVWHRVIIHTVPALILLGYTWIARSRLQHIAISPLNIFFRNRRPKGELQPIDLEKAENFGASQLEHFTWKQLMDQDACTRCGRCQDACPAFFSGKTLSPKKLTLDLRAHMQQVYPVPFSNKPIDPRPDMITEGVTEAAIWDCTTCRACEHVCPVYIERIDKIVDMRRSLTMERTQMPESAQEALKCLSTRDHPWRGTTAGRTDWANGLDVKTMEESSQVEYLYWVGCTGALEERNMKVSAAMVKVLKAAGVSFGILGIEESCCGDPARKMGDEYLFQTLCQKNIETFKKYGVKKIFTTCPHCFNMLKKEYPQFGGDYEVFHHTQLIAQLIKDGKLKPQSKTGDGKVVLHDSCYLGRYNDIYNEPREILGAVKANRVEVSRSRSNGFCCGGGGGHMWMEEEPDKRLNVRRTEQMLEVKPETIASACPYCLAMFEDGLKTKGVAEQVHAKDVAEILAEQL